MSNSSTGIYENFSTEGFLLYEKNDIYMKEGNQKKKLNFLNICFLVRDLRKSDVGEGKECEKIKKNISVIDTDHAASGMIYKLFFKVCVADKEQWQAVKDKVTVAANKVMAQQASEKEKTTQGELEATQGKLQEAQGELEATQGKLQEAQGKLQEVQGKLQEVQEGIEKNNQQLEENNKQLEAIKQAAQECKSTGPQGSEVRSEVRNGVPTGDKQEELERENSLLQQKVKKLTAGVKKAEADLSKLIDGINKLYKAAILDGKEGIASIHKLVAIDSYINNLITNNSKKEKEKDQQIKKIEGELVKKKNEIDGLQSQVDALSAESHDAQRASKTIEELKAQVKELEKELRQALLEVENPESELYLKYVEKFLAPFTQESEKSIDMVRKEEKLSVQKELAEEKKVLEDRVSVLESEVGTLKTSLKATKEQACDEYRQNIAGLEENLARQLLSQVGYSNFIYSSISLIVPAPLKQYKERLLPTKTQGGKGLFQKLMDHLNMDKNSRLENGKMSELDIEQQLANPDSELYKKCVFSRVALLQKQLQNELEKVALQRRGLAARSAKSKGLKRLKLRVCKSKV